MKSAKQRIDTITLHQRKLEKLQAIKRSMLEKMLSLRVLRFDKPDQQWLRFVVANRKGAAPADEWDIIHGPVANDQTIPVIDLFLDGMYDEEETIKRLLPQKLKDQYTFRSDSAIALLRFKEVISV